MKSFTSANEIETLCSGIVKEFMYFCHNTNGRCVDIIGLTTDYLNMPIFIEEFANPELGRNGFYSDGGEALEIVRDGHIQSVTFPKNSMVLDKRLKSADNLAILRFVIAHEASHYILGEYDPALDKAAFHTEFVKSTDYPMDLLKEMFNLCEAITDRAARCLLMPDFLVQRALKKYNNGEKIVRYDECVMTLDNKIKVQQMADALGVEYEKMITRLYELDLFEVRPLSEYLSRFRHMEMSDEQ